VQNLPVNCLSSSACRIACFSDTYGLAANNGVGRFLHDLREMALARDLPLNLFVPGKGVDDVNLQYLRAPSFTLPGYPDAPISMPLEYHRKTIVHNLKDWKPDVLHVSTPGPFGCFGITLARQLRLPLVGIYHTDFSGYAREVVRSKLQCWQDNPSRLGELLANSPLQRLGDEGFHRLEDLRRLNPRFDEDLESICDVISRNWQIVTCEYDITDMGAKLAHDAMARVLIRFYSHFTLIAARSLAQRDHLEKTIGVAPDRIRLLVPGTDVSRFHPRYKKPDVWQRFGISPDAFVALYVGRMTCEKNFDFVLEIWRVLQEREKASRRDIRLVVVGHGESDQTQRAARQPGIHVIGAHGDGMLSTLYASSHVLLFPSITETLGQVGLEAGASGLPVIVSNQGGPSTYVQPNETGYVLQTDDAERWAEKVLALATNETLRLNLAENARNHIESRHTLDASLRSYWQIHAEAIQRVADEEAIRLRDKSAGKKFRPNRGYTKLPGVMVITDYHAGRQFGSARQRKQKEAALREFLQRAADNDLTVIYGGDFGDHGARPARLEEDFAMLRRVQQRVGLRQLPVFIRGNHDYGFTDEQLTQWTGGCSIHDSLVYYDERSRITVTHGHILGLHRVLEVIRSTRGGCALQRALREDSLDEDLKPSVIAYDLANLVDSYTQQLGLTGLGRFWEGLFKTRGVVAESLLEFGKQGNDRDERTWKLIASLVGSHNDVEVAALLGAAGGSWATVVGHTHKPGVRKLKLRRDRIGRLAIDRSTSESGERGGFVHLVANAGNMNRKRPSCVIAQYPEIRVYRYRPDSNRLSVAQRGWLDDSQIKQYQSNSTHALDVAPTNQSRDDCAPA
jgi:glycosyltransferase involved in cell wall biosynthesis/predicted phosphodiesterase